MPYRSRTLRYAPLVLALYALSAITFGLAHRPFAEVGAFTAAYGAAAADICTTHGGDHPGAAGTVGRGCDACRLTAAPGLMPPAGPCLRPPPTIAVTPPPVPAAGPHAPSIFRAVSRGPPSAAILSA